MLSWPFLPFALLGKERSEQLLNQSIGSLFHRYLLLRKRAMPYADVINFLKSCQAASGGFGGGPLQLPHLAPTYAATAALVSLGGDEALDAADRPAMLDFICRLAVPPQHGGGFQVCQGVLARSMHLHAFWCIGSSLATKLRMGISSQCQALRSTLHRAVHNLEHYRMLTDSTGRGECAVAGGR